MEFYTLTQFNAYSHLLSWTIKQVRSVFHMILEFKKKKKSVIFKTRLSTVSHLVTQKKKKRKKKKCLHLLGQKKKRNCSHFYNTKSDFISQQQRHKTKIQGLHTAGLQYPLIQVTKKYKSCLNPHYIGI